MSKIISSNYYEVIDGTTMYYEDYVEQLQQENKELKKTLENNSKINVADHKYASEMEDKYLTEHNIITEFEKWLEEYIKQYPCMNCENKIFKPNVEYEIAKEIYDKLQGLKRGKNEKSNG